MLKATDLTKSHDGAPLFDGLSLTLDDGARAALVGANGVGKTTLLRLLAGVDRPDRGAVALGAARPRRLPAAGRARPATAPSTTSYAERWARCGRCGSSSTRWRPTCTTSTPTAARRSASRRSAAGRWRRGWTRRGAGSGIEHLDRGTRLGKLSGGEAARCLLAAVLLGEPTVLLLDEPTNHLDADGREWLAEWLADFAGTLLTISHDRDFLDATVRAHLRALRGRPRGLRGRLHGLSRGARAAARAARAGDRGAGQVPPPARGRHRDDVAARPSTPSAPSRARSAPKFKRYAKKVAKKSKAREHRLQREMDSQDVAARAARPGRVQGAARERGRRAAADRGAARRDASPASFDDVDLTLHGGDRVALVGPNGAGKSTLLHLLAAGSRRTPARSTCAATTRLLPQVPQRLEGGLLEWFRAQTSLPEDEARTLLAHYRLGSEAIARPMARLSPGERARVHVAAIVGGGAELILLDEPTNHLDFDTLEVIEAALRAYRGTLVIATHDRALIEAVGCDRVVEVRDGRVTEWDRVS